MNRALLASLTVVGMCAIVVYAGPNELKDEGVGTYSDSSVVNQVSNFTINRQMISCGVGTVSGGGIGFSGPFAMLMSPEISPITTPTISLRSSRLEAGCDRSRTSRA